MVKKRNRNIIIGASVIGIGGTGAFLLYRKRKIVKISGPPSVYLAAYDFKKSDGSWGAKVFKLEKFDQFVRNVKADSKDGRITIWMYSGSSAATLEKAGKVPNGASTLLPDNAGWGLIIVASPAAFPPGLPIDGWKQVNITDVTNTIRKTIDEVEKELGVKASARDDDYFMEVSV